MIFIQSNETRTLPHHFDLASVLYRCIESNQDYKFIKFDDITLYKNLIKSNLFVGTVEFMKKVFSEVGLNDIRVPMNSNRPSKLMTLGEILEIAKTKNLFIKSYEIKAVSGMILNHYTLSYLSHMDKNIKFLVYEPFESNILTEWRLYIHNNKIVDSKNYSGDFKLSPNYDYFKQIIDNNKDFPKAYTMDVGLLEDGEEVVIEYNDFWAIGNYGIPNDLYLRMLKDRYFEIMKRGY